MQETSTQPSCPRIGLALPRADLGARLEQALAETEVELLELDPGFERWSQLEQLGLEVLVVLRERLDDRALSAIRGAAERGRGPGVVAIDEDPGQVERAELVAAGVARVLDAAERPDRLADTIELLGKAQLAGGQDGPETRGANAQPQLADFLSRSPYMRRFLDTVQRVSDAEASLLITGETGVGKERLARAIHAESPRSEGPFVAINCGALPESLLESELFGHEKGAFTGADVKRSGLFEHAQGGTVFLDEIGEMPSSLQVKLLTVLQRHEVVRVGGSEPIPLDVRVLAATNRDVKSEVEAGTFREDLYYRLNVVSLEIPSLRERSSDIPDLVGSLIGYFAERGTVLTVSEEAMQALVRHAWPGNVRELVNAIERAVLLTDGDEIQLDSLPAEVVGNDRPSASTSPGSGGAPDGGSGLPPEWLAGSIKELRAHVVERAEREYLEHHLREERGHVARTAKRAGITPRALYDRLKALGIDRHDFR